MVGESARVLPFQEQISKVNGIFLGTIELSENGSDDLCPVLNWQLVVARVWQIL